MIITMTRAEMIAEWRLRKGLLPVASSEGERTDGLAVDTMIARRIDDWYLHKLDTADPALLPVAELVPRVGYEVYEDLTVRVTLPERCRRVVSVKMDHWKQAVSRFEDPDSFRTRLGASEFVGGGEERPTVSCRGKELTIYRAASTESTIESLKCIEEPEEGVYRFDARLLEDIALPDPEF